MDCYKRQTLAAEQTLRDRSRRGGKGREISKVSPNGHANHADYSESTFLGYSIELMCSDFWIFHFSLELHILRHVEMLGWFHEAG